MNEQPEKAAAQQSASQPIVDDKAHIRHELDLKNATWRKYGPDALIAFITHTDGLTYVGLRSEGTALLPDGKGGYKQAATTDDGEPVTLIFNPKEWTAFLGGAFDGEFNTVLPGETPPRETND